MSGKAFVPDDLEVPEEPGGSQGNPGNEGEVMKSLKALQDEVSELREKVATRQAPEVTVESILDSESFRNLIQDANAQTLERVISKTQGLDDSVKKALFLTLGKIRQESSGEEDEPEVSEGQRCLELRDRIRTLKEEIESLDGDRAAFTDEGEQKRSQDRKLIALLEGERKSAIEILNGILAVMPDVKPEGDDDYWSR